MKRFKEVIKQDTSDALIVQRTMQYSKHLYTFDPGLQLISKYDSQETFYHFKAVFERGISHFVKVDYAAIMDQLDMYFTNDHTNADFFSKLAKDIVVYDKKPPITMEDVADKKPDMLLNVYWKSMVVTELKRMR